jgi:hypothetical protein
VIPIREEAGLQLEPQRLSRRPGPTMPTSKPEFTAPHITGGAGHHDLRHHSARHPALPRGKPPGPRAELVGAAPVILYPALLSHFPDERASVPGPQPFLPVIRLGFPVWPPHLAASGAGGASTLG